jgi:Repeat of unknown function (DUF5648)
MIRTILTKLTVLTLCFVVVFSSVVVLNPPRANALSGSQFNAGRIMDDFVFFNPATMSVGDIQAFLNAKVPVCDTNGSQPYGGTTRAAYAATKGYSAPFTCLKDYRQNTIYKPAEAGLCSGFTAGNYSAAEIIYHVGHSCGINPRVLIVLLQKEQSLITDDWPWSIQYRSATGYGCPDTAPCDAEYYGFFNQVYSAARQFKRYARDANLFTYRSGRNNYIQYNPNAACGGSNVFIQNQATAGLYNYTPYQPNPSALANLYGSGDACGAYGNRNFWRMFNDWFGTTNANCNLFNLDGLVYRMYNPATGDYLITNNNVEVCLSSLYSGYIHDGTAFPTPPAGTPGTIPVYRLVQGTAHFYTTNAGERDYVVANLGFTYEGVAFQAMSAPTAGYSPVYRLRTQTNRHFFTSSISERTNMVATYGHAYEGVAFYMPNANTGSVPVYRMLTPNGRHFYTSSTVERDYAQSLGYVSEGIGFYASNGSADSTLPVYRTRSPMEHIYTTNMAERMHLIRSGYGNEAIAFYSPVSGTPGTAPVYRLYRPSDGDHLYTTSVIERDTAVRSYRFIYEGQAFGSY